MDPVIQFPCPVCGERLKATPDQAGKTGRCPICHHKTVVPAVVRDSHEVFSAESVEGATSDRALYCSTCGTRAVGNFCSYCGCRFTPPPLPAAWAESEPSQASGLAGRPPALASAATSSEDLEELRAALLHDMTNLELRKRYLRVRTPDMRLLDESMHSDPPPIPAEARSQAMIYFYIIGSIGVVLGFVLTPVMGPSGPFLLGGFGIWLGYMIVSQMIAPARAIAEEHLAALRARCAELGPLPDDAPTDPVAVRQRFLGA
jgi:hypothetical protein